MFNAVQQALAAIQALSGELKSTQGVITPKSSDDETRNRLKLSDVVTDSELYKVVHKLFGDGHHARAVEEACKFLNKLIQKRTGSGSDGADLMRSVFSPNKPLLMINEGESSSEKNEQKGYMDIFAGVMTGLRNPRAHDHEWEDTEERALQLLNMINHLVLRTRAATKP